ncbi:MAG: hypothetical protein IT572_12075 [Deltaproteobacteria bacterium]|nr:hypothetical protein [Deltaproteobacteria bacterium]
MENSTLGSVPGSWGKYLTPGSVTATLDVYGSDGAPATHVDLIVDMEQGTVSAPQFKIPIGDTYRFIIIFSYALSASEAIPYAYADFTWLVDEFSEEVSFSENDIRYGYDAQDPLISASLSEGKIPNLDLDGDGWTNWEELRDKVNPKSPTSVPIVPTVEVRGQQDGTATTATVVVTARDNAHVEDLRLVDPLCGVTVISDTLVNNVDGSVTRTLTLRLDLLSVSKNPRTLQGLADDGVTPAQNANHTLNFTVVGSASQPYFVFTEPEEKGELEGPAVFRGVACSRAEIDIDSVRFTNQEISSVSWVGQRTVSGDFELSSETVDTTVLPDGLVVLRTEVRDSNSKVGQGSREFSIVNDSQIKVVSPVGRRWVFGNEKISVSVVNLPDTTIVVAEGPPEWDFGVPNAASAFGTLTVGNLPDGTVIPLTFRAVRMDGSEVVRKVEFTVRNKPQIQFMPEATKVFRNWSTNLLYKVVNVDPQQLFIEGEPTNGKGSRVCEEDAVAKGIIVCTGKFPVKVVNSESFDILATRSATTGESCEGNCKAEVNSGTINSGGALSKDIPEINAAIVGDDEMEAPARVKFPPESPTQHYRLTIKDLREGTEIFTDELQSDETAILNSLEPRRDYTATLQVLNGPGGNVLAEMFKEFTTGDLGLVGWWRFSDSFLGMDISGRNNHGSITGAIKQTDELGAYLELDDYGDRMDAPINGFTPLQGTLTFWFIPNFDFYVPIGHGSNAEIVTFLDIGGWSANSLRVLYSNNSTYCPNPSYDHSLCLDIHGAPAPNEPIANIGQKFLPSTENWNFVAVTWDQLSDQISVYNNQTNSTVTFPLSFTFGFANNKLSFGYSGVTSEAWPTWAFWYKGLFRDASGYGKALGEAEIKEICNGIYPGGCP